MKIFSGSSNKPLAEKIAKEFERSLSPLEIFIFPDGEKRVQVQVPVVDEDVVIIQSTATPAAENYMELFFIADALRRNGAREITVVMPYMGYQRQDHVFRTGEAVSLQVVISMLEALKINRVIACDLHSIKIP
ncbi:MAG: ribose-phosphate pyrophosphokinae, partial [Patescibacteria group bacterium]|nr:ribose-phosphate pyrophosphokinae [Patescibacteria group bacterium]